MKFALYSSGYEILGIGETVEEAKEDAAAHLDEGQTDLGRAEYRDSPATQELTGSLYVRPCTERLYSALLRDDDTEIVYDVNADGLLDLVDESMEED